MSQTVVSQTGNQLHVDTDTSKIFIANNRYRPNEILLNDSGGIKDFLPGTLMGRVTASLKLTPLKSGAVDGSQIYVGVLATEATQLGIAGETIVNLCIEGDIVRNKLVFDGADTLDTLIGGQPIKDIINANSGVILVDDFQQTAFDNQ